MNSLQLNDKSNAKFSIGDYFPALDGLRGLAILMIILYHNFDFLSFTYPTWSGVDLFFVLSGFLITGILIKKRNSAHFLFNFYARRVLRIFPIYFLSLIIFLFILPNLIKYPLSLDYFTINQYWFWLEIQNWLFILKPNGNNNFLNHFWSLALEEQFYLISPWIILLIKQFQKIISFLLVTLLLLQVLRLALWYLQVKNISYINLYGFTRIDGLCVGSLLAIFRNQGSFKMGNFNRALSILFILLVFFVFPFFKLFYNARLPYLAICLYPAIAFFWGMIVWFSIRPESLMYRIFNNKFLIFFGKISYGLYIFHWPINWILQLRLEIFTNTEYLFWNNLLLALISTSIAILISTISYYTYEKFFLGLKRYFT
jgi:peptidoglycan/LPS O-acetylase OafA/YrhL